MKISPVLNYNTNLISFKKTELDKKTVLHNNTTLTCGIGLITLASIVGVMIYKRFGEGKKFDTEFKNNIQKSLQQEGVNVSLDALNSIVGPEEFNNLVKKFKPSHYRAGLQTSKPDIPVESFYKNAINGDFRVSLHTHSNYSDGKATPEEFLECARKYADKVAKLNKNDRLPPFTIALTDHDSVEGTKVIIKLISQNPEKYKNLKFIAGCEFSVKDSEKHYDVTGLALNPFDKDLNNMLDKLRKARKNTIQEFLNSKQKENNSNITIEDLIKYEREHYKSKGKDYKHTIENGSGLVYIRHAIKYYYKLIDKPINLEELNRLDCKDILPIEEVVNTINRNGGYASLTHPLKSFWKYIGDEELLRLKNIGITGIEVNHQYTPSKILTLGEKSKYGRNNADKAYSEITEKYKVFAEKHGMFMSGGTDSHEKQIFSREVKITDELLNNKILK